MKNLKVVLKRSTIGATQNQRACVAGLGLKRPRQERILENTPAVRGMIKKVMHLVDVQELDA
jgi:large subunit ribosomal protein L30